jgi:hypothetical protein
MVAIVVTPGDGFVSPRQVASANFLELIGSSRAGPALFMYIRRTERQQQMLDLPES